MRMSPYFPSGMIVATCTHTYKGESEVSTCFFPVHVILAEDCPS